MASFRRALDELVAKYRSRPFEYWAAQHAQSQELQDTAEGEPGEPGWWQADTTVLEVERDSSGFEYALVTVTVYPPGINSSPPAPSASFSVFRDGRVTEVEWVGESHAPAPPNTSFERTRDK